MKKTGLVYFIFSLLLLANTVCAQTIDSKNFFSVINGVWLAEYYTFDWKPMLDKKFYPNTDTVFINQNGKVKTARWHEGKEYSFEEEWTSYDDKNKRIYHRYLQMDKTYSKVLERYKVLSINKNQIKVEFTGYSELEPKKPIKSRIIFTRIKN